MTHIKSLTVICAAALAAALLACGGEQVHERQLLETVPASSSITVVGDIDKLLKSAGCSSRRGSITLTDPVADALERLHLQPLISSLAQHGSVLDLTKVVFMRDDHKQLVATACLRHDITAEDIDPNSPQLESHLLGDMRCSQQADGVSMIWTDSQAWMAQMPPEHLMAHIDSLINLADKMSVAWITPLNQFFTANSILLARIACDESGNPVGDNFDAILCECFLADRSLSVTAWTEKNYRRVDAFSALCHIDPAPMAQMPLGCIVAASIGLTPESISRLEAWCKSLPTAKKLIVSAVLGVINDDGGTLSVGATPGGSAETIKNLTLDNWLVKATLPSDDEKSEAAMAIIDNLNAIAYGLSDSTYISIMNFDPEDYDCETDMRLPRMHSADAALLAQVAYKSQVMRAFGLKNGYTMQVVCADSCARLSLSLLGPASYILPAIATDIDRLATDFQ